MVCAMHSNAQYWMQKGGSVTIDESIDIAVDGSNNAYTVGYFTGFGGFGATFLNSSGSTDIFITKTNSQGNFVWAKKAGGSGSDRAEAVAVDNIGNIYVVGYFTGTATFGTVSLTSVGGRDIFITKYNSSGTVLWAVKAGGTGADLGFGIDVNNVGEVFVTGAFKNTASFGALSLTAANSTSDIFITKLNSSGVFQWVKSGTGNFPNLGRSIGADNYGNVYVTGQFSDTITFDQTYNNQSQNIIFLVKYDSTGNQLWFTQMDGALSNVAHDMAVDTVGNCYITGDFEGIMKVYDITTGTSSNVTSTYPNTIFTVRYDSSGLWNLKGALGSNNFISSQSIAIDNVGNYYIGGHFECDFTEFTASMGEANLLSVGSQDVFVTKFSSTGVTSNTRNIGGPSEDLCFGVAVNNAGNIYASGSFSNKINIPISTSFNASNLAFWSSSNCNTNVGYCGALDYGQYRSMIAQGNKDAFMVNAFDPNREPYDYFQRSGLGCVKDYGTICIANCMDTVFACEDTVIAVNPEICTDIGPDLAIDWSIPGAGNTRLISNSGWYFVTVSNADGCFSMTDSVYVDISALPNVPLLSDGKGFNIDSLLTTPVQLCAPDTTLLTGRGYAATDSVWWEGPGLGGRVYDSVCVAAATGTYTFYVKNANGCIEINTILVKENFPLPPFQLEIKEGDSLEVCFPDPFTIQLYDSISNPSAAGVCLSTNVFTVFSWWNSVPTLPYQSFCDTYNYFEADSSGTYTIYDTTTRFNYCYADTFWTERTVYVTVNPKPVVTPFPIFITGNPVICPGGSTTLTASGAPNYEWFGSGVWGNTDSVVNVSNAARYTVQSSVTDTNIYGCTETFSISNSLNVGFKGQPTITANPLVICPGATVDITSSSFSGNAWEGPNGPIVGGSTITVTDPGQYFTVVNDADSCGLVSNTVTIQQYTTPKIVPYGDTTICPGASTIIGVQASSGSTVTWDPPLSGSSTVQVISTPGTYTCSIVSCGITTVASITIYLGNPLAQINPSGVLCKDSSIILQGPPGMVSYLWLPSNETTQNITVDSSNTYTLSIVDAFGCAGTSAPFILNELSPNAELLNTSLGYCFGDSIILQADTGLASYLWLPSGDTTRSIIVNQPGSYSLTVADSNGCATDGDPFFVNASDSNAQVILAGDSIICERDTVWLNPVITGYTSYAWYPGGQSTLNLPVTDSGTYVLIATDSIGCVVESDTFNIDLLASPINVVSSNGVLCKDSVLTLNASNISANYQWFPGNQTTSSITVNAPGIYSLLVTDTNGCQSLPDTFQVDQIVVPVAITNARLGFCEGDSILLNANSGMSQYLWMPSGNTTNAIWMTTSGSVILSVVDTNGCTAQVGPVSVTQSTASTSQNTISSDEICEGDSLILTASNTGFSSYNWSPGNVDSTSIVVTETGMYWFSAIDSIGCISKSDSVSINVVQNNLVPPIVFVDSVVCLGSNVLFTADGGSNDVYWYEVIGNAPIHVGDSLMRQIYSYTTLYVQTISEPCASEFETVNVYTDDCDKDPGNPNVFTPNGDGVNDGWSISILGATCYEVEIYNRWGILIYTLETNGQEWDGKIERSDMDAADGVYYYILNYCDYKKDKFAKTGYITLIR